jgi:hypothetical protein
MYFWDVPPAWKYTWVCLRMGYTMIYRYAHDGGPFHRANAEQILINQRILNDGTMGSPKKTTSQMRSAVAGGSVWIIAAIQWQSGCREATALVMHGNDGFMTVSWWFHDDLVTLQRRCNQNKNGFTSERELVCDQTRTGILESNSGQILFLHEQTQAISAITKKKREYIAIDQKRVMYVQEGGSRC